MRGFALFLASSAVLAGAAGARAADLPSLKGEPAAPAMASCDFFQNQLIGSFCDRTYGATLTLEHDQLTENYANFLPPGNVGSQTGRLDSLEATAAAYVVPLPWLRLTVSSEHNNYSDVDSLNVSASPIGPYQNRYVYRLSNAAWQNFDATVRLIDYNTDGLRAFVSANANIGFISGVAGNPERTVFSGSLYGGLHWGLGGSDWSLNPYGTITLQHYDNPDQDNLQSTFRVLLAQDAWGLAIGPNITTNSVFYRQGGGPQPAQNYFAGVRMVVQPFRLSQIAILKDVNLEFGVEHSLGEVSAPSLAPNADEMIYSGSVRFNFGY